MKVLVTGACGFIGSHLCGHLLEHGHDVIGIDNLSGKYEKRAYTENISIIKKYPRGVFAKADVLDRKKILALSGKGITHIVHLAAKTGIRDSITDPEAYFSVNVLGTKNVLDLAVKDGIINVVLASTSSVYGKNPLPFREDMPTNTPLSPYAASKISMEALAHSYHNIHNLPIIILRFFTVYGPRGRRDMAIYRFTEQISKGKPVHVFGDGSTKRDFTYVDDIIFGVTAAMNSGPGFNIYNLGCSRPIALNNIISLIEKNLGKKAELILEPARPEDVNATLADIIKANKGLRYYPKIQIEEGLKRFVEWFRKHATR